MESDSLSRVCSLISRLALQRKRSRIYIAGTQPPFALTLNLFPAPGIFFRKKNIPRSEKLASLGVWRLSPDWAEIRFGMTPWAARIRALATVSLRGMETTLGRSRSGSRGATLFGLLDPTPTTAARIDMRDHRITVSAFGTARDVPGCLVMIVKVSRAPGNRNDDAAPLLTFGVNIRSVKRSGILDPGARCVVNMPYHVYVELFTKPDSQ